MSLPATRAWFKDELKSVLWIALLEIPFPCILRKSKGSKIKHIFLIILTLFPWALTSRYKHSKKCNAFIHTAVGMCGSWKPTASSGHLIKGISTFPLGVFTFSTTLSILVTLYLSLLLKSCLEIKDFSSQLEEMKMVVSKNKAYTMRKRQRGGGQCSSQPRNRFL